MTTDVREANARRWFAESRWRDVPCMFGVGGRRATDRCGQPATVFCAGGVSDHTYWPVWCDEHAPHCRGHEHYRIEGGDEVRNG